MTPTLTSSLLLYRSGNGLEYYGACRTEWKASGGQQSAQQMWNAPYQQPYAPPAYPYSYATSGYSHAPPNAYPPFSYSAAAPVYNGYAPPAGMPPPAGAVPYGGGASYVPPSAASAPPSYGSHGPPTKKRLTSESQLSTASYGHQYHTSGNSGPYYAPYGYSNTAATGGAPQHPHQYTPSPAAPPASAPSSSASKSDSEWPPALRKFIERCFEQMLEKDRSEMETKLYAMVADAKASNTLWTRDWAKMAIPVTSSQLSAPSHQPTTYASITSSNKKKGALAVAPFASPSTPTSYASKKADKRAKRKQAEEEEEEAARKASRASRFRDTTSAATAKTSSSSAPSPWGYGSFIEVSSYEDTEPIVGTSTTLEKPYLRLTERPNPSSVRPLSVLKKSLALMREKKHSGAPWKEYLSGQMQSIRQDIIIQAIADEFALEVYETNARWCLEHDDIPEFKRCLLRIDEFYNHLDLTSEHQDEFSCYALLFHLLPEDFPSLNAELATLAHGRKKLSQSLRHCVRICEAYVDNNWSLFFQLSKTTHFLEKHLLDPAAERLRINSLTSIFVSYVNDHLPLIQDSHSRQAY